MEMTLDEVREKVKEIVAGVRFGTLPTYRAIVELMKMFRTVVIVEELGNNAEPVRITNSEPSDDARVELTDEGIKVAQED